MEQIASSQKRSEGRRDQPRISDGQPGEEIEPKVASSIEGGCPGHALAS